MKLFALIATSIIWSAIAFVLFTVIPHKTSKIVFTILSFAAFLAILFFGGCAIYKWGAYWGMETQARTILGLCCCVQIVASILDNRIVKKREKHGKTDTIPTLE